MHVEVNGQLADVGSLLLPAEPQISNSRSSGLGAIPLTFQVQEFGKDTKQCPRGPPLTTFYFPRKMDLKCHFLHNKM